jgi:hypothetical protein
MKRISQHKLNDNQKHNAYGIKNETGNLIPCADGASGCTKLSNNLKQMPMKHTRVFTDPKTEV